MIDSREVDFGIVVDDGEVGRVYEVKKLHTDVLLVVQSPKKMKGKSTFDNLIISRTQKGGLSQRSLQCRTCGADRSLQISFPGVFGKEQGIDETLASFHRFFGLRIAGAIFLGFSGIWDEALVRYLADQAKALQAPLISLSATKTTAIEETASERGIPYEFIEFVSGDENDSAQRALLEQLLPTAIEYTQDGGAYQSSSNIQFPPDAFSLIETETEITLGDQFKVSVNADQELDSFANAAAGAFRHPLITRLKHCSQLGLKSIFLQEKEEDVAQHNRFKHSTSATLVGLLWHDALLKNATVTDRWSSSKEACLALEMAILFHDARHLPFSHMMEEIFAELNWGKAPGVGWPDIARYMEKLDVDQQLAEVLRSALPRAFEKAEPKDWWETVVSNLQDGLSGVPWLEAIVDSALDADKIEYIFQDTKLTNQKVRLSDWKPWFEAFVSGQRLTPEGLIRLEGESCHAAFELLQERAHLYRRLYHAPELRALECLARYIVLTWLKWIVPDRLDIKSGTFYRRSSDLRSAKVEAAGDAIWEVFRDKGKTQNELVGLKHMANAICENDAIDDAAREWVKQLWTILARFEVDNSHESNVSEPSRRLSLQILGELQPFGPFFVHKNFEKILRKIVRNFRVHFPLLGLIDIAVFPDFLATPKIRYKSIGASRATAEHFLVPGRTPTEWRRGRLASTPLHLCDFSGYQLPVMQVIIIDPWGSSSGGSAFIYEMLMREMQGSGIPHSDSPEGAAEQGHSGASRSY